jgi:hypothetical protein
MTATILGSDEYKEAFHAHARASAAYRIAAHCHRVGAITSEEFIGLQKEHTFANNRFDEACRKEQDKQQAIN